jgi:hypothetical protein
MTTATSPVKFTVENHDFGSPLSLRAHVNCKHPDHKSPCWMVRQNEKTIVFITFPKDCDPDLIKNSTTPYWLGSQYDPNLPEEWILYAG